MLTISIMNPDHEICTLDQGASLSIEFTVQNGKGYVASGLNIIEDKPIEVDTYQRNFDPIVQVSYDVDNARVGQQTDYDKLLLNVKTDGSVTPEDAVTYAARIMQDHCKILLILMNRKKKKLYQRLMIYHLIKIF